MKAFYSLTFWFLHRMAETGKMMSHGWPFSGLLVFGISLVLLYVRVPLVQTKTKNPNKTSPPVARDWHLSTYVPSVEQVSRTSSRKANRLVRCVPCLPWRPSSSAWWKLISDMVKHLTTCLMTKYAEALVGDTVRFGPNRILSNTSTGLHGKLKQFRKCKN